jgi:tetratricopeptide (TPR) repeat protein
LKIEPDNEACLYNAGLLANIKSEYQKGIELLEKSLQLNKENIYALLALGDALERTKEVKKAINIYRQIM